MRTEPTRTFIGCVVSADLVGYSLKPVAHQGIIKDAFNQVVAAAIAQTPADERIIQDTGDGANITFLGDPDYAYRVAIALRDGMNGAGPPLRLTENAPSPVRMGVNLGPVRASLDMNGHTRLIGDGIHRAERIAALAQPGEVVVSRSFHDIAARLSHVHAAAFEHLGIRVDKTGREYDVYAFRSSEAIAAAAIRRGDPDPRDMTQAIRRPDFLKPPK